MGTVKRSYLFFERAEARAKRESNNYQRKRQEFSLQLRALPFNASGTKRAEAQAKRESSNYQRKRGVIYQPQIPCQARNDNILWVLHTCKKK